MHRFCSFHQRFVLCVLLLFVSSLCAVAEVVSYEDFGAAGDGKTDDFEALVNAHEYANKKGWPVRASDEANYYIGGADRTIRIRTDTNFGKARFTIDDRNLENHGSDVFRVESGLKSIKVKDVDRLSVGQDSIGGNFPQSCVITAEDSNVRRFIRRGGNQNDGSKQTDSFIVDRWGRVDPRTPIIWNFERVTRLVARPMNKETLTVHGGVFTTIAHSKKSTNYHARGISIQRSNVVVEGLQHHITGEGEDGPPYRGFITISHCANVVVRNTRLTGRKTYYKIGSAGRRVPMGSYGISMNSALNVALVNVTQFNDITDRSRWGIMGTNYCKNLLLDGCELSRFDAHQGVTNATIRNSTIGHMGVLLTGFGRFLIEDSTVKSRRFIGLRPDYGSTWKGDIIIRNCRYEPIGRGVILSGSNDGQHDFGYTCQMPGRLLIDGLKIEDGEPSDRGKGPVLFDDFNPRLTSADYEQKFPYEITREVILKDVTTTSGKPLKLSENEFMFRDVEVKE